MTYETAFKRLKEKFQNLPIHELCDVAIQVTLSDEDCGGTFYVKVEDHKMLIEPYDYKDNNLAIDTTRKTLSLILDGKLSVEKAVENGEFTIMGDLRCFETIKNAIVPYKKTQTKKQAQKESYPKKTTKTKK